MVCFHQPEATEHNSVIFGKDGDRLKNMTKTNEHEPGTISTMEMEVGGILFAGSVYLVLWVATFYGFSCSIRLARCGQPVVSPAGLRFLLLAFGWAGVLLNCLPSWRMACCRLLDVGGEPLRFWDWQQIFSSPFAPPSFCHCGAGFLIRNFSMPSHFAPFFSAALIVSALMAFGAIPGSARPSPSPSHCSVLADRQFHRHHYPLRRCCWVGIAGARSVSVPYTGASAALLMLYWRDHVPRVIDSLLLGAAPLGAALLGRVGMLWGFDLEQHFPFAPLFLGCCRWLAWRCAAACVVLCWGRWCWRVDWRYWSRCMATPTRYCNVQMGMIAIALTGLLLGGNGGPQPSARTLASHNETLQRGW